MTAVVAATTATPRVVDDIGSVDHACAVPVSDEQLWETTAAWVAVGLARGERVLYFEDGTAHAVLDRLRDDRVPVRDALAAGQLTIVPAEHTRAALRSPVEQVEEMLVAEIDGAAADGWAGVRISSQASYALQRPGGVDLSEYERGLERVLEARPGARALCLYDHRRFPEPDIARMRGMHHTELLGRAVYDDTLLRITATGPASARLAGEVDHSNRLRIRTLLERALDDALRSHSATTDIVLDLSSLRFVDVAGAVSLVHAAEEFPSSHRLVLEGVRPRVQRLLDRCGAPFAPQLVVRGREGPAGRHR